MAEPYKTNQEAVTVVPATTKPKLVVASARDEYVTENIAGGTLTVHASDAKWLKKRGVVS